MKIEALKTERKEEFFEYCRRYREELSDEYITEESLKEFVLDDENPTYVMLNDSDKIVAAASLMIDDYHKSGNVGRFRIFHSSLPYKEVYRRMLETIMEHTAGLKEIFLYIKETDSMRKDILEDIDFKKKGYSYTLIRDDIEVSKVSFPEDYKLVTFIPGVHEKDWCIVRNIGFPEDIPRTPENVRFYWEVNPEAHLEGGMFLLYHKEEPVGTIRASVEKEKDAYYTYISVVCVNPEHRRKGLATNLLRTALSFGKIKGYDKAMLCVDPDNEKAIDVYLKEGFEKLYGAVEYAYEIKN